MEIKGLNKTQSDILYQYIVKYFGDGPDGEGISAIKEFDDVVDFFLCAGDKKEEFDSDYLTTTYYVEDGGLKFCVDYSQYRKDGGLCNGDWGKEIYVI